MALRTRLGTRCYHQVKNLATLSVLYNVTSQSEALGKMQEPQQTVKERDCEMG